MPLTVLLLAATLLAGPLELRARLVGESVLEVLVVTHGSAPVLVTPRTTLGCYLEVEVQDSTGAVVGHFGPRANCPTPSEGDFRILVGDVDAGAQLFGVDLDVLAPGRLRLNAGSEEAEWEAGREYRFVVSYHNEDARILSAKRRTALRRSSPELIIPIVDLRSQPVTFRKPS